MIDLYTKLPQVYFNESRDFQIIAKVYEALYNYIKSNSDLISTNLDYKSFDTRLLLLLSKTLGFEAIHNYNNKSLYAVCSCFKSMMKKKGSKASIEECLKAILNAQEINEKPEVNVDTENCIINILVPDQDMNDIILIEDLMNYILPAGYIYNINQGNIIRYVHQDFATTADVLARNEDADDESLGTITIPTKFNTFEEELRSTDINGQSYTSVVVGEQEGGAEE